MEDEAAPIDLIDDIWLSIFNWVPFTARVHLTEVSKRWQQLALRPLAWRTVEYKRENNYEEDFITKLTRFLSARCSMVVDLNLNFLEYLYGEEECHIPALIDTVFAMKSLHRAVLAGVCVEYIPKQVPACRDLKFLNIDASFKDKSLFHLLSALPNLEELYLPRKQDDPLNLELAIPKNTLTKLQRLSIRGRVDVQTITAALPSLEYLIVKGVRVPAVSQINNTMVINTRKAFKRPILLETFKKVSPILVPYASRKYIAPVMSALLQEYETTKGYIEFMVKELGYDLNVSYKNDIAYRPSFFPTSTCEDHQYPMQVALECFHDPKANALVTELLELGATAECPDPNISYLTLAESTEVVLNLLRNGADPNKLVQIGETIGPAYFCWLKQGKESIEVSEFLKDRIDLEYKWQDLSVLRWTVTYRDWTSFRVFVNAGAKIEISSLPQLLRHSEISLDLFHLVMCKKSYYDDGNAVQDVGKDLLQSICQCPGFVPLPNPMKKEDTGIRWNMSKKDTYVQIIPDDMVPAPTINVETSFENITISPKIDVNPTRSSFLTPFSSPSPKPTNEGSTPIFEQFALAFNADNSFTTTTASSTITSPSNFNPFSFVTPMQTSPFGTLSNNASPSSNIFSTPSSTSTANNSSPMTPNPFMVTPSTTPTRTREEKKLKRLQAKAKFDVDTCIYYDPTEEVNYFKTAFPPVDAPTNAKELPPPFRLHNFETSFERTLELTKDFINDQSQSGETALLLACMANLFLAEKSYRVKTLVANGADVNIGNDRGWTPLHAVCYSCEWPLVDFLVDNGAKLDAQDDYGVTPLVAAVYGMHIAKTSEPNPCQHLHATLSKCTNAIFTLVEENSHRTLAHMLATVASPKEFEVIRDKCDVNVRDATGYTPLHYAIYFGNLELVNYLIDNGADPNAQTFALKVTPTMLLLHLLTFATVGETEYTTYFLSQMSLFGTKPFVNDDGFRMRINPQWLEYDEGSPLTQVDMKIFFENPTKILAKLIEKSNLLLADGEGNTILHLYVKYYCREAIKLFESQTELWSIKNNTRDSPFALACRYELLGTCISGLKNIAEAAKINLTERDSQGRALVDYILDSSLPASVKQEWAKFKPVSKKPLISKSLEPDSANILKRTPLMLALIKMQRTTQQRKEARAEFKAELKKQTPNIINEQDDNGDTALHLACRYFLFSFLEAKRGHTVMLGERIFYKPVFELLQCGADPKIKNNKRETPFDYTPHLDPSSPFFLRTIPK